MLKNIIEGKYYTENTLKIVHMKPDIYTLLHTYCWNAAQIFSQKLAHWCRASGMTDDETHHFRP